MKPKQRASAFHLDGLDTRYFLQVEEPAPELGGPWPVVLCLDGDDQFETLRHARKELAKTRALPPLLLVGIGYGASYQEPANRRIRDYTPCPIEGGKEGGGAEAFLGFLTGVLWPELARRYPIHPTLRGIAGHSLGALFGLHALFRPRPFFSRVLASAPSLWWGERAVLAEARSWKATGTALPARVFLGVGTDDSDSMRSDLEELESLLVECHFLDLQATSETFAGRNHFNSIQPAFEHVWRRCFRAPRKGEAETWRGLFSGRTKQRIR